MVANMIIVSGEANVCRNMSKVTNGYTTDKYAVMELIQKIFNYGRRKDLNLGQDLYTVIECYFEDKLEEYPELEDLKLYRNPDLADDLYVLISSIIPKDCINGDNIYYLSVIYYTLDDQIYQFKSSLNEKETLLELAENYESISALKR